MNTKDFWYAPGGEALGSSGAPSSPWDMGDGPEDSGFGQPMIVVQRDLDEFVRHTARIYGKVADAQGALQDPRGQNALSSNPSDYWEGQDMDVDAPEHLTFEEDALIQKTGEPEFHSFRVGTPIQRGVLAQEGTGLSESGVEKLAAALEVQSPGTLAGLSVPTGPLRSTFIGESGLADVHPGYEEPLAHLLTRKRAVPEMVDSNGVIYNRYAPGTGPYDAPGGSREGGIGGARPGTVISGCNAITCKTFGAPTIGAPLTPIQQYGGGGNSAPAPIAKMTTFQEATPGPSETTNSSSPAGSSQGLTECKKALAQFIIEVKANNRQGAMVALDRGLDMGCPWAAKARDAMEAMAAQNAAQTAPAYTPEYGASGAPEQNGDLAAAAKASGYTTPWAHIFGFVGVTAAVVAGGMLVYRGVQ